MYYENKFGIRLGAFIIDYFILGVLSQILISFGLGVEYALFDDFVYTELTYWQNLLLLLIYFVGFAIMNKGITIGKMITGLKVKTSNNGDVEQNKLILREFVKVILMPILIVSFFVTILRKDKKSIHDLVFDTHVVKQKNKIVDPYHLGKSSNKSEVEYEEVPVEKQEYSKPTSFNRPSNREDYYDDPAERKKEEYEDPLDEYDKDPFNDERY